MKASSEGRQRLQAFEGLRLAAYKDEGGVWTVGYGHTGSQVGPRTKITREQAEKLLEGRLEEVAASVTALVKVPVSQAQFDALVSLTYNIGAGAFKRSTLLRKLNAGDYAGAAEQFMRWRYVRGVESMGLLKRRKAERDLFLSSPAPAKA